jgi:hypothetical protein
LAQGMAWPGLDTLIRLSEERPVRAHPSRSESIRVDPSRSESIRVRGGTWTGSSPPPLPSLFASQSPANLRPISGQAPADLQSSTARRSRAHGACRLTKRVGPPAACAVAAKDRGRRPPRRPRRRTAARAPLESVLCAVTRRGRRRKEAGRAKGEGRDRREKEGECLA